MGVPDARGRNDGAPGAARSRCGDDDRRVGRVRRLLQPARPERLAVAADHPRLRRRTGSSSRVLAYLVPAVLPFYILHQPLIVGLGYLSRDWSAPDHPRLPGRGTGRARDQPVPLRVRHPPVPSTPGRLRHGCCAGAEPPPDGVGRDGAARVTGAGAAVSRCTGTPRHSRRTPRPGRRTRRQGPTTVRRWWLRGLGRWLPGRSTSAGRT